MQQRSIHDAIRITSLDHPSLPLPYLPFGIAVLSLSYVVKSYAKGQPSPRTALSKDHVANVAQLPHPTSQPPLKSKYPNLPPQDFLHRRQHIVTVLRAADGAWQPLA